MMPILSGAGAWACAMAMAPTAARPAAAATTPANRTAFATFIPFFLPYARAKPQWRELSPAGQPRKASIKSPHREGGDGGTTNNPRSRGAHEGVQGVHSRQERQP